MKLETLKCLLSEGEVSFKFKKKDGSIREARGTTCSNLIPKEEPKEGEELKPKKKVVLSPNVTRYYDLDKNQWRSFSNDSLIVDETIEEQKVQN